MLLGFSLVKSHVIQISPAAAAIKNIPHANIGRLPIKSARIAGSRQAVNQFIFVM